MAKAKLTLDSIKVHKTDDGGPGGSEWRLNIDIEVAGKLNKHIDFDKSLDDVSLDDPPDVFPVGVETTISNVTKGTYSPKLSITAYGVEDDPVNDDALPTKVLPRLHYHDQDFTLTATNPEFSYSLDWHFDVM